MRTGKAFTTGVAAALFLAIFAGLLSLATGDRSELSAFLKRSKGERIAEPLIGAQAEYRFEVRTDGRVSGGSLSGVQARLVFLNFWGTFCEPCIEELPSLLAMARSRAKDDFVVLAVSYDESWEVIDSFFKRFTSESLPANFVVARDAGGAGRDLKSLFGTEKIPESYILKDGLVEAKFVNARDWTDPQIVGLLNLLLGK